LRLAPIAIALGLTLLATSVVLQVLILLRLDSAEGVPISIRQVATTHELPVKVNGVGRRVSIPVSIQGEPVKVDIWDESLTDPLPVRIEK
jgi:hypothetical protein